MSVQLSVLSVDDAAMAEDQECTDALLLDAWVRYRDSEAFSALVNRHSKWVMGVCRRQCGGYQDAEDAFQATFLILARDGHKLRRGERVMGWLHKVAYRTCLKMRNHHNTNNEPLLEEPAARSDSLESVARRHRLRTLDEELELLPESYRTAVMLHYIEGYSYQQTAEMMNVSQPAVRGRLQRARKRLQQRLVRRGVSLSIALVGVQQSYATEAVPAQLIQRVEDSITQPDSLKTSQQIDSLVPTEPLIMLSPAVIGTLGATALTLVGLIVSQISFPDGGGLGSPNDAVILSADLADPAARAGNDKTAAISNLNPEREPLENSLQSFDEANPNALARNNRATANPELSDPNRIVDSQFDPMIARRGAVASGQPSPWAFGDNEGAAYIEKKLAEKRVNKFSEEPLENVIQRWEEDYQMPIVIDAASLDELGIDSESLLISSDDSELSLEAKMELLLVPHELSYTINHEVLRITTLDADHEHNQLLRVYWTGDSGLQANTESAELLQALVNPDSWEVMGGWGKIGVLNSGAGGKSGFAVRNTYRTHKMIERFLDSVRKGAAGPMTGTTPNSGADGQFGGALGPDQGGFF